MAGSAASKGSPTSKSVIVKYLPVYFVLLAIAALEVFLAYQHFSIGSLLAILLALAVCGGALAGMYFMHLAEERRNPFFTLIPAPHVVLPVMDKTWCGS